MKLLARCGRLWLANPNRACGLALLGTAASALVGWSGLAWAFATLALASVLIYVGRFWRDFLQIGSAFVLGGFWLLFALQSPSQAQAGLARAWFGNALLAGWVYAYYANLFGWWRWPQRWQTFLHRLLVERAFERALWPLLSCLSFGLAMTLFRENLGASALAALPGLVLLARALARRDARARAAKEEMLALIEARDFGDEWRGSWRGQAVVVTFFGGGRYRGPSYSSRLAIPCAAVAWTLDRDAEDAARLSTPPEWQERLAALSLPSLFETRPALTSFTSHPSRGEVEACFEGGLASATQLRADLEAMVEASEQVAVAVQPGAAISVPHEA